MSVPTAAPQTDERSVTMSAADLQRLIADVAQGGGMLPPGAYRADGEVWRDALEPTGRRRPVKGPDGKPLPGRFESVDRRVKRRVYLTYDTSPSGLVKGKREAQRAGLDFWHPTYGWLRYGTKRETEVPENMGAGSEKFEMVYTPIESEDDSGSSSATVQGVPIESDDFAPPSSSGLSSFDEALTRDPEGQTLAEAVRRGPGRPSNASRGAMSAVAEKE